VPNVNFVDFLIIIFWHLNHMVRKNLVASVFLILAKKLIRDMGIGLVG